MGDDVTRRGFTHCRMDTPSSNISHPDVIGQNSADRVHDSNDERGGEIHSYNGIPPRVEVRKWALDDVD